MTKTQPIIRLTLQPLPHVVPEGPRLRQLLKRLLRSLGLRCLSIDVLPAPAAGPAGGYQAATPAGARQ